jgi:NAD(P)-dependent dehydrogenase (short-subunit alcohol dehydrogenase family)
LYGNFGQSNYGAAKLGLVGLMNTLKIEGAKANIRINTIAPVAATRMTENLGIPEEVFKQLKPELISPAVVYLASEDAPSGTIIEAGAGYFAKAQIVESKGVKIGQTASVEDFAAAFEKITDMTDAKPHANGSEIIMKILSP